MSATEPTSPVPGLEPDDGDDLRGYHFRKLLRTRGTYVWIALGAIVFGLFMWLEFFLEVGIVAALVSIPFGFWCAWRKADSRAAEDFMHAYAKRRGLKLGGQAHLPETTPLLSKGTDRYASQTLEGRLTPEVEGTLAMFTVVTEHPGTRSYEKSYHPYTIGLVEVPESRRLIPELYCGRREGLRSFDGLEDAFRRSRKRVELESDALDQKFELFAAASQDENRLKQLFSPSFIVWMTESAPPNLAFELVDGTLVVYARGFRENAAELDAMAAATGTIALRLREESTE